MNNHQEQLNYKSKLTKTNNTNSSLQSSQIVMSPIVRPNFNQFNKSKKFMNVLSKKYLRSFNHNQSYVNEYQNQQQKTSINNLCNFLSDTSQKCKKVFCNEAEEQMDNQKIGKWEGRKVHILKHNSNLIIDYKASAFSSPINELIKLQNDDFYYKSD